MRSLLVRLGLLGLGVMAAACAGNQVEEEEPIVGEDALTSTDGTPLEFKFDAEVIAARETPAKNAIVSQLEYLQGVLTTGAKANAQFRFVDVQNTVEENQGETKKKIRYSGSVAVVFPAGARIPTKYDVAFPRDVTALSAFNDKYDGKCGTNEYGRETFWHDFNPKASGCTLESDVVKARATVRPHPLGTTDKFPEYDKIWADNRLDIVAVYGAISNTSDTDTGARDREALITKVKDSLTGGAREDVAPVGGILKHTIVTGKKRVGNTDRNVRLVAYFVSEAQSAGREFMESYSAETEKADIVLYSGHSGLGKNIAALAKATKAQRNKYQIAFFNGCQTLGYLGPWMQEARTALNGAQNDPNGTKYLDVIVTALPAYAEPLPTEQILYDAVLERSKGWGDLLRLFGGQQWNKHLTTVFGEDDNTFRP